MGEATTAGSPGTARLAPGFLVAFGAGGLRFPHLRDPALRTVRPRSLALVEELSKDAPRSLDDVIDAVVARTSADRDALAQFVDALRDAGRLTTIATPAQHAGASVVPLTGAPAVDADTPLALLSPGSFVVEDGAFLWFDQEGVLRARLTAEELLAMNTFAAPRSISDAFEVYAKTRPRYLREDFEALTSDLIRAGLLRPAAPPKPDAVASGARPAARSPQAVVQEAVLAAVEAHDAAAASRPGERVPVIPVNTDYGIAPASLGLLVAFAMGVDDGRLRDRYDFVPLFLTDETVLLERALRPSVFLFSNYVWNVDRNLELSALVKQVSPESITVHGGPSTPKYERDAEVFFAEHPHVDVAVHGEGEATFAAMLDALDGRRLGDLDRLRDVAGLTYRSGDSVVRTGDRERITDLDLIPSPYLLGLFDPFGAVQAGAIIETNRGCPYGCTFCDWGSATLSRIRKFSLERVFAELEWSAQHQIDIASLADANFGIMERDVEIAQKIAELKRTYGFPRTVAVNYAKNTVKHLRQIIEIFAEVEILTEGVVSLQSMDEPTLKIIRRSNIKLDKYNELSTEFRRARLPLAADIMMGLPGSTPTAFRNDLQQCTDRDVRVRANPTQLLPNSPMNDPAYRAEHGITAKPGEMLTETASYTRAEWEQMDRLRRAYYAFDNWGVLRYIARFVRQETGLHEVDFYDRLRDDVDREPTTWPMIATTLEVLETFMAPPGSWSLFIEEVRRYLTTRVGIADDSALRTALAVQLAHLPAAERSFPVSLQLEHDFVAWQDALLAAREDGHRDDWERVVPRLATYGPAELKISDPNEICRTDIGKPMAALAFALRSWELDSPVARPRLGLLAAG